MPIRGPAFSPYSSLNESRPLIERDASEHTDASGVDDEDATLSETASERTVGSPAPAPRQVAPATIPGAGALRGAEQPTAWHSPLTAPLIGTTGFDTGGAQGINQLTHDFSTFQPHGWTPTSEDKPAPLKLDKQREQWLRAQTKAGLALHSAAAIAGGGLIDGVRFGSKAAHAVNSTAGMALFGDGIRKDQRPEGTGETMHVLKKNGLLGLAATGAGAAAATVVGATLAGPLASSAKFTAASCAAIAGAAIGVTAGASRCLGAIAGGLTFSAVSMFKGTNAGRNAASSVFDFFNKMHKDLVSSGTSAAPNLTSRLFSYAKKNYQEIPASYANAVKSTVRDGTAFAAHVASIGRALAHTAVSCYGIGVGATVGGVAGAIAAAGVAIGYGVRGLPLNDQYERLPADKKTKKPTREILYAPFEEEENDGGGADNDEAPLLVRHKGRGSNDDSSTY